MGLSLGLGAGASLGLGCGTSSGFHCSDDTECGAGGTCQPGSGYCSFPDEDCPSEQRYGEHAGNGLAGACVESSGSTGPAGSTSDEADASAGAVECEDQGTCLPPAPEGWEGPMLALLDTGEAPACPPTAPDELGVGWAVRVAGHVHVRVRHRGGL